MLFRGGGVEGTPPLFRHLLGVSTGAEQARNVEILDGYAVAQSNEVVGQAEARGARAALSASLRRTLANPARFLAHVTELPTEPVPGAAGTGSDSAIRVDKPLSIPTGFRGADTTSRSASCRTTTYLCRTGAWTGWGAPQRLCGSGRLVPQVGDEKVGLRVVVRTKEGSSDAQAGECTIP